MTKSVQEAVTRRGVDAKSVCLCIINTNQKTNTKARVCIYCL